MARSRRKRPSPPPTHLPIRLTKSSLSRVQEQFLKTTNVLTKTGYNNLNDNTQEVLCNHDFRACYHSYVAQLQPSQALCFWEQERLFYQRSFDLKKPVCWNPYQKLLAQFPEVYELKQLLAYCMNLDSLEKSITQVIHYATPPERHLWNYYQRQTQGKSWPVNKLSLISWPYAFLALQVDTQATLHNYLKPIEPMLKDFSSAQLIDLISRFPDQRHATISCKQQEKIYKKIQPELHLKPTIAHWKAWTLTKLPIEPSLALALKSATSDHNVTFGENSCHNLLDYWYTRWLDTQT